MKICLDSYSVGKNRSRQDFGLCRILSGRGDMRFWDGGRSESGHEQHVLRTRLKRLVPSAAGNTVEGQSAAGNVEGKWVLTAQVDVHARRLRPQPSASFPWRWFRSDNASPPQWTLCSVCPFCFPLISGQA